MRTTLNLDDDVAAEVARLRHDESLGLSEAVNRLARAGMTRGTRARRFKQRTFDMGEPRIDLSNIGEVLGLLDEADTDFARFPDVRWINPLTA